MGNIIKYIKNSNSIEIIDIHNNSLIPQPRVPSLDNILNIQKYNNTGCLKKFINSIKDKNKDKINNLNLIELESELSINLNDKFNFNRLKSYPDDNLDLNFIKSNSSVIIIIIDFINSTEIIIKESIIRLINISKQFNKDILNLLNNNIFSYINIYEIIGDSYILTINFPNTNQTLYPSLLAIKFCKNIINISNSYINIRIGISYENVYYGIINNHIRIFSRGICLASRLENKALKNIIFCCENFYNQYLEEIKVKEIKYNFIFNNYNSELKGLGICNYYSFDLEKLNLSKILPISGDL